MPKDVLADAIGQYLHNQGLGTFENNGNIVTDVFQSSPVKQIMIRSTGGFAPPRDTTSRLTFMIQTRADYSDENEQLARQIYDALNDKYNFWLTPHIYVFEMAAMAEPGSIGQDENGNSLFSCNYYMRAKFY